MSTPTEGHRNLFAALRVLPAQGRRGVRRRGHPVPTLGRSTHPASGLSPPLSHLLGGVDGDRLPLPGEGGDGGQDSAQTPGEGPARLVLNEGRGERDVTVDTLLDVQAESAVLERVTVSSPAGDVPGEVSVDGTQWVAGERLEPGAAYTVRAVGRDADGAAVRSVTRFRTQDLSLAEQTYVAGRHRGARRPRRQRRLGAVLTPPPACPRPGLLSHRGRRPGPRSGDRAFGVVRVGQ